MASLETGPGCGLRDVGAPRGREQRLRPGGRRRNPGQGGGRAGSCRRWRRAPRADHAVGAAPGNTGGQEGERAELVLPEGGLDPRLRQAEGGGARAVR